MLTVASRAFGRGGRGEVPTIPKSDRSLTVVNEDLTDVHIVTTQAYR